MFSGFKNQSDGKANRRLSVKAIVSFLLSLVLCALIIVAIQSNTINLQKSLMEQVALEKSLKINEILTRLLYKTQALSVLAIQNDGVIDNFERVAATIIDDPSILNVLIAPSGVVSHVYPYQGNEATIGLDFFSEGAGNKEAVLAKKTGQLTIGGPFDLRQGGQGLVGRLPVYVNTPNGEREFWGLVSVTLKFPQILENIGLETLEKQGLAYKIWRINPDNSEEQLIASSKTSYSEDTNFVEKPIHILNAEWTFCVYPVLRWYERPESWVMIVVGFFISFLFAFIVQNNHMLTLVQVELQKMARTDSLTGVYNRHSFMELAQLQFEKAVRSNNECFIIIFDLDYFKNINDKYGHQAGDKALREIVQTAKAVIRSYDLMARYGGEEFIMFITDIGKTDVLSLIERIRRNIYELPIKFNGESITVSASFGVTLANASVDLNAAIGCADKALYQAKEAGRNRTVFYENKMG